MDLQFCRLYDELLLVLVVDLLRIHYLFDVGPLLLRQERRRGHLLRMELICVLIIERLVLHSVQLLQAEVVVGLRCVLLALDILLLFL